jgi:glyoxylate reductase
MARVFVTRRIPGDALERLAAEHQVDIWEGRLQPSHAKLLEKAGEAEGLLTLLTDRIDADLIAACSKLRVISNYAVGVDNVDVEAATKRGIPVGFTPDVLTEATADATFALLLASARRVVEGDQVVRAGRWLTWEPTLLLGQDVYGKTLGIVGMGRIGKAVARRAEGFGMEVIQHSWSSGIPLDELLERADFVSLHAPLTDESRGMIDEGQLKRMKQTAILINTSRGPLVDSGALTRALADGWIAGAALDVADPEPIPKGHPLLDAPNLILNPHIASASIEARTAMANLAVDNLLAGLAGEPLPKCVNPDAGKRKGTVPSRQ